MHQETTTRPNAVPIRSGIVTLSGYGIKVAVDRRHLAVSDGVGRRRREGRFAKATSRIRRLVVVAQTGFITLEALRWLHDAKAAFIQLDHDGSILTASIGSLDDARLRRAQALLPMTDHRLSIARELLEAKIKGQLAVLDSFGLAGGRGVREALTLLDRADRLDIVLIAEAKAAEAYWDAWGSVPMEFARRDRVPDHWRTFGMRRSPLTLAPRTAANPLNAMLNYLYTLLEVETRIALIGRGLDPGLALFHADEANRQSLAADVMEPVRPHVDAFVLNLVRTRTFSAKDFAETREGAPPRIIDRARIGTDNGSMGEARRPLCRERCKARRPPRKEWPRHRGADRAEAIDRSCACEGAGAADRGACCAEGRSIGADRDGSQCLPQLRCQAHDPKARLLRSLFPRSDGSATARADSRVPSRGSSQDRSHARSRSRSDDDAGSAAPPSCHSFKSTQSRCSVAG
jgi:CRISPR-associated endonuclease Cas1